MSAKWIGVIILLVFLVVLAIQNYQPLTLKILFWTFETSAVLTILVSFTLGFLVGGLVGLIRAGKKKQSSLPSPKE